MDSIADKHFYLILCLSVLNDFSLHRFTGRISDVDFPTHVSIENFPVFVGDVVWKN